MSFNIGLSGLQAAAASRSLATISPIPQPLASRNHALNLLTFMQTPLVPASTNPLLVFASREWSSSLLRAILN